MKSIIVRNKFLSICIVAFFILTIVLLINNVNKKTVFKLDGAQKNIKRIMVKNLCYNSSITYGTTKDKTEVEKIVSFLNSIEFKEIEAPAEVKKEYGLILAGKEGTLGDYIEFNEDSIKFQSKFFELSSNKKQELKMIIYGIVY